MEPVMPLTNIAGPPVSGANLYGREGELREIWARLKGGHNLTLLAPRRIGKTSLMHELRRVPSQGWIVFYSDLERCNAASECVADVLAHVSTDERTKTLFEAAA